MDNNSFGEGEKVQDHYNPHSGITNKKKSD